MAVLKIKENDRWVGIKSVTGPAGKDYILTEQDKTDIAAQVVIQTPTVVQVASTTPTITADIGTIYQCGEITSLSFTPCPVGICEIIFTSGATPTDLTLSPNVKTPSWFDTANLDPNTIYDISIINGTLGAVSKWAT